MVSPLHVVIITHLMQFRQNRWILFQKSIAQEHHVIDCPLESCSLVHVGIHAWYYCLEKFCCFGYAYPIGRKKCKHTLKSASQAHTLDVRKLKRGMEEEIATSNPFPGLFLQKTGESYLYPSRFSKGKALGEGFCYAGLRTWKTQVDDFFDRPNSYALKTTRV